MDQRKNYASHKEEHQPVIEDQNTCCLCGSELVFKHTVDFATLQVREESECPSCLVKMKTKDHTLQ